jgi:hypothetical protein
MTHFQNNSQAIGKATLVHLNHSTDVRKQIMQSLFSGAQVIAGIALLALSTHLALQSDAYLEVLNQSGLNQYHAFALLVCLSFIAGILLIAQQVLKHDVHDFDKVSSY